MPINARATFGALGGALLVSGLYLYSAGNGYVERPMGLSKHVALPDGGKACMAFFGLADGGQAWRTLLQCDCARKPADGGTCTFKDGGDPGVFNRWPMERLTGAGCELCACSVYLGQDSNDLDAPPLGFDGGAPAVVDAGAIDAGPSGAVAE